MGGVLQCKMARKKKDVNWGLIVGIAIIILLFVGATNGWFQINITLPPQNQNISIAPDAQQPVYSSCSQVCSQNGFSKYYNFIDSCKAGESKITYGYPGQPPLLICCCYNDAPVQTCTDTDGDDRDTPGHVVYNGDTYYDKCLAVGNGVTEYICENNRAVSKNWACDLGETCVQTRSGGHCVASIPPAHVWHPGEIVFSGSGTGSITGGTLPVGGTIDLSEYGITTDGTCLLGARFQTSWAYDNPSLCAGIQGMEGIRWSLYDSNGLEYSRLDPSPIGLGVDLHPTEHYLEWDGTTDWRATISKTLNIPTCNVNYEYDVEIYIYSC